MAKIAKFSLPAWYLPGTIWVFYDKKSVVSVSDETQFFEPKFFCNFNHGKMLLILFHRMEKTLILLFSYTHS